MKRQGLSKWFTSGVLAMSMLASSTPALASDIFLKIDGIKGESQDSKHKDQIEILSWSWGQSTGTARVKKGRLPATCIQDLHLMKEVDSSTPALITNGILGNVAPTAVLTLRKAGGDDPIEFLKLTMKNVTVVSFQVSGSDGSNSLPTESVSLHFESMTGEYRRQNPNGTLQDPITWDITAGNQACEP
jgi:type VI secretion system secreted protein Hcp